MKQVRQCKAMLAAAVLLLLGSAGAAAQEYQPFAPTDIDTDLQIFAPAELGSFGERPDPHEGYFFTFEKINWNIGGVKAPIGIESPTILSPDYQPGGTITQAPVPNTFDVSLPEARFGWGERYELGYMEDKEGWLVGVLHGPSDAQEMFLGSQVNPTGSIVIAFSDPYNIFSGFVDLRADGPGGGHTTGPDGNADDINGNGVHGPDGLDTDGDGVPDTIAPTDFGDLVTLLPKFDSIAIRTITRLDSVEVMKMYRFRPFHNGSNLELQVGARFVRMDDVFDVNATGTPPPTTTLPISTIGDSFWNTDVDNNLVGPQVAGRWFSTRGRWTVNVQGRFLAAANIQNADMVGTLGAITTQNFNNGPDNFASTSFRHNRRDINFSPVAELRVQTSFQITRSFAATLGYTALYMGDITRASQSVGYSVPDMSLLEGGHADLFTNGVNFGVEFNR